jgi:monoamine oxidase
MVQGNDKLSSTMISRRTFLLSGAAAVASPASAAPPSAVDVAIIGAGAAGIAAARRIAQANRRFVVLEASNHIGGRCVTDTSTFGVAFDRGARLLYAPDLNAAALAATKANVDIYPSPPGQKIRIGRRNARETEMEDFLSSLVRANRALGEAGRKADISAAQALPKDLGPWRGTIDFMLGPIAISKDLSETSVYDLTRLADRDSAGLCRGGLGAMMVKVASGVPVELSMPVTRIDWSARSAIDIETARGRISARAVIVTASTNVLNAGKIAFTPALPRPKLDAFSKLSLGSLDTIALEIPGNPLGLQRDDLVFDRSDNARTAALIANVGGSSLCLVQVGGKFGRGLAAQGDAAMIAFARDWLADLFGSEVTKSIKRTAATRWNDEPWTLGAMSVAAPGAQNFRKALMEPVANRIWFAGEAAHETLWGTVGGAWESGERAATDALRKIGALPDTPTGTPSIVAPARRPKRAAADGQ